VEFSRNEPADPQYPPMGAAIDFWLSPDAARAPLSLEILDAAGTVLRRFGPRPRAATPHDTTDATRVVTTAGVNRFYWDLALPGPAGGGAGPLVVPGEYRVRLSAGGYRGEQPLTIRIDPRIARDGVTIADLREQFEHNLKARDLLSEVNGLVSRVDSARRRLATATGAPADTLARLNALRAKLVTPPVRYSRPELQAHIAYLYSLTTSADQKIGRDAVDRYKELRAELDRLKAEAEALIGKVAAKTLPSPQRGGEDRSTRHARSRPTFAKQST
jgi:hypothetical protein